MMNTLGVFGGDIVLTLEKGRWEGGRGRDSQLRNREKEEGVCGGIKGEEKFRLL